MSAWKYVSNDIIRDVIIFNLLWQNIQIWVIELKSAFDILFLNNRKINKFFTE